MAIVTTATSITPPPGAEELLAHLWQATASIADWVTYSQGCNELQVRNLIEHLQPSKLLFTTNMLQGFHIPELATARTLQATWRIFAAQNLGWTDHREEGCIDGFSAKVNSPQKFITYRWRNTGGL